MLHDDLKEQYFGWLCHLVCGDIEQGQLTYFKLLRFLHSIEFVYYVDFDDNRAQDGIDFRYRFGYAKGYSREKIRMQIGTGPCSVLEMMVALAFKVEEQITHDLAYGDRTGQWFWNMIVSLDLGNMNDKDYNERYCNYVVMKFLDRNYSPNGKGGLFALENPPEDLREVDIWTQCMWYLNENS